jgi:hypothetical protein
LRSGACDLVAALQEIGGVLRATRGPDDEPHWLESLAREIGETRSPRKSTPPPTPPWASSTPSGMISGSAGELRRNNAAGRGGGPLASPGIEGRSDRQGGEGRA